MGATSRGDIAKLPLQLFYNCLCHCSPGKTFEAGAAGAMPSGTDEEYFATVLTPAGAGALEAQLQALPPAAQARARAAHEKRQAEIYERQRRHVEQGKPVYFVYRCNGARDCLSGSGWQGALPGSLNNAYAWVKPDPKRTVDVYDQPGGALLAHIVNLSMGDSTTPTTDKVELEQRRLASREILGKI